MSFTPIAVGNPAQRVTPDGRERFHFIPDEDGAIAVANVAAITVAELTASHDLSAYTPKGGWSGSPTFNKSPNTDVTDIFDAEGQGTWSMSPQWQLYLQHPDNNAFELFSPGGLTGLLVHFWACSLKEPAVSGDPYYAYRLETAIPVPIPGTSNEKQRFDLSPAIVEAPVFDGTLVSGGGG